MLTRHWPIWRDIKQSKILKRPNWSTGVLTYNCELQLTVIIALGLTKMSFISAQTLAYLRGHCWETHLA